MGASLNGRNEQGMFWHCEKLQEMFRTRELVVRGGWELQQLEVEAMMGSQKLLLS